MRRLLALFAACLVLLVLTVATAPAASASGSWTWPVVGPVIRGFDPPESRYGSGHRGIDIAAVIGSSVVSAAPGVVSFAGRVGGELFVSVDHGGGVMSSYSFLSFIGVHRGDVVAEGAAVGRTGAGHPGAEPSHLHFGLRVDGEYVDPMSYLRPPSVVSLIRLAPLER
jgi:murein DD-endopeptidase MepM/ murein hydrolase activator NlpD